MYYISCSIRDGARYTYLYILIFFYLSKEIEKTKIDFKEDSAPFKNFVTWSEKSLTITSNLEQILAKIDKTILQEQQERRTKAEDGSVESYIRKT